jgi:hypothetical protein
VTIQSVPQVVQQHNFTDAEISRIADRVAIALVPMLGQIGNVAPTAQEVQSQSTRDPQGPNWDVDRATIIDCAIRTMGQTMENFGELPDAAPGDRVDVDKLVGGLRSVVEHVEPPAESV